MQFISNLKKTNHKSVILELLEWAEKCILCTSFLDGEGVKHLSKSISYGIKNRDLKITVYSNGEKDYTKSSGITALSELIKIGLNHKVTSGKRRLHSKIYYFENANQFIAVIGSANITHNGLVKNIEFSTKVLGIIGSPEHKVIYDNLLLLDNEC
jgi:HKD family nuclease